jgi:hypothetical protein
VCRFQTLTQSAERESGGGEEEEEEEEEEMVWDDELRAWLAGLAGDDDGENMEPTALHEVRGWVRGRQSPVECTRFQPLHLSSDLVISSLLLSTHSSYRYAPEQPQQHVGGGIIPPVVADAATPMDATATFSEAGSAGGGEEAEVVVGVETAAAAGEERHEDGATAAAASAASAVGAVNSDLLNSADTHSLKPPGFFSLQAYEVMSWFLKVLLSQMQLVCRYGSAPPPFADAAIAEDKEMESDDDAVRLYKLHLQLTPQLESARLQPLGLPLDPS